MSTPWILYRLYKLDISSAAFLPYLRSLIRYDGREQYLANIQGPELDRLVNFLDEVRTLPSALCLGTKQALQTLNGLSAHDDVSRQCLGKLQAICAHRAILPQSYAVSGNPARVGSHPIIFVKLPTYGKVLIAAGEFLSSL